jgi:hypothetical protein
MQQPIGPGKDLSRKWLAYQSLRFILDVDTLSIGYSIEKASWHKRYINSTHLYLLDLRK